MTQRNAGGRDGAAGFTLIEMLVVLVILGLVVSLVAARGPARSPVLDARAAAALVAQTLREARAQAVGGNRAVTVVFDAAANRFGIPGGRVSVLPPTLHMVLARDAGRAGIGFAPDGSSTGGEIGLAVKGRRFVVAVNWLTGRVGVTEAPPALAGNTS